VLQASFPAEEIDTAAPASYLGQIAPRLHPGRPVVPQLHAAAAQWSPEASAALRDMITEIPGRSGAAIRELMYRLMNLPEPEWTPEVTPVPLPRPIAIPETTGADL
jgi:hypothetical protein